MRKSLRWLLIPLGVALFLTAFATQEGNALSAVSQQATPTFIPSDRLLQPTLPVNPSQADEGAVDYWLNCMVCHGDRGQGLTEEFRMLYPPEEQTCWQSGCHGARPYENGFTLPTAIPPVVGAEAPLHNFADASVLYTFMSTAMPWHKPGSLEPEVYWRLTAYLLRENGYENPYEELGPENSGFIPLRGDLESTEIAQVTAHPTLGVENELTEPPIGHMVESSGSVIVAIFVIAALLIVGIFVLIRRRSARLRS